MSESSTTNPIIVYGVPPSGNSQKAILGCGLLNIPYVLHLVPNLIGPDSEQGGLSGAKTDEFKKLNPRGLVPVIVDENNRNDNLPVVVSDSAAILTYLALTYNPSWYPLDSPLRAAKVNFWLSYSNNEITHSLLKVRVSKRFGWDISPLSYPEAIENSRKVLEYLNDEITSLVNAGQSWLVPGNSPTIADISVFPYVAFTEHSSEGELSLSDYPEVLNWLNRFKSLPGYVSPPGI